jgi:hypothetical protein
MRRNGMPGTGDMLKMVLTNAAVAFVLLKITLALFGGGDIIRARMASWSVTADDADIDFVLLLLPGAAIAFTGLWQWLIRGGRKHGLSWGSALFYGVSIAFVNVPFSGFVLGIVNGNPLMGLLLALVSLLLIPSLFIAMTCFGLAMGFFNGIRAQGWLDEHKAE